MIRALTHRAVIQRPIARAVAPLVTTDSPGVLIADRRRCSRPAPVGELTRRDHRNRTAAGQSIFLPAARAMRAVTLRPSGIAGGRPFFVRACHRRQASGSRAHVPAYPLNLPHLDPFVPAISTEHGGLPECWQRSGRRVA